MDKNNNVNLNSFSHGGARPGAGRPKVAEPRRAHSFSCTDPEAAIIKRVLEFLRARPELTERFLKEMVKLQESLPKQYQASSVKNLQWLESEEESKGVLKHTEQSEAKAKTKNLQWLESEEEVQ